MDDISSLAFAGIYSLLILSMTFHFLLALRIRQFKKDVERYEESVEGKINTMRERLERLESVLEKK